MAPLTGESFFLTIAQIGLGFAGFSGLLIALRRQPVSGWSSRETTGMRFMLEHSFAIVPLALFPSLLYYQWLGSEPRVWQILNAALALLLVVFFVNVLLRFRRVPNPAYPKLLLFCYVIPTLILLLVEASRACAGGSALWFGIGLIYLLVQAAAQFWVFLALYTKDSPP